MQCYCVVANFLTDCLSPILSDDCILILDNAATHHTPMIRGILHDVTNGRYCYSPPYLPHFKPIEKCFKLVKRQFRANETAALLNPVAFINGTFDLFAVGGARAPSIMGHWAPYFRAHELLKND